MNEEEEKAKVQWSDSKEGERGGRGRKVWQRGVIAERIERVQRHLMVGERD